MKLLLILTFVTVFHYGHFKDLAKRFIDIPKKYLATAKKDFDDAVHREEVAFLNIISRRFPAPSAKIIGGRDAPDGGIPYQVSLRYTNSHFCGATLLNRRWVLTAAHCAVAYDKEGISIVVGTNSLVKGGENYDVEEVIVHEDYNSEKIINDISLMKAAKEIEFNDRVQPIDLPKTETRPGASILLTGWGKEADDSPIPALLQMLNQTVTDIRSCQTQFKDINPVTRNNLCTITPRGSGACQGDSGGPLVHNNRIVGLVSWGVDCELVYPDVATSIYSYKHWILKHMKHDSHPHPHHIRRTILHSLF